MISVIEYMTYGYDYILRKHFREKKNTSETEFLEAEIAKLEVRIYELNNLTDSDLRDKIILSEQKLINEPGFNEHVEKILENEKYYIERDLLNYESILLEFKIKLNRLPKGNRKRNSKNIGENLTIADKYALLNSAIDLEKVLRTSSYSDGSKYKLLGLILDCNETNARQLMNGNYTTQPKTNVVEEIISTLK